MLKSQSASGKETLPHNLTGLYTVKEFYINQQSTPRPITGSSWKKIAINKFGFVTVQFMNDSTYGFSSKIDSIDNDRFDCLE